MTQDAIAVQLDALRVQLVEIDQRTAATSERLTVVQSQMGELVAALAAERAEASRVRERCWTLAESVLVAARTVVTEGPSLRFLALVAMLLLGVGAATATDLGDLWRAVTPWPSAAGAEVDPDLDPGLDPEAPPDAPGAAGAPGDLDLESPPV